MKVQIITTIILTMTIYAWGQDTDLFIGESKLIDCKVDIPLTYKKKDKASYTQGAIENKDIELVLLKYNKKTKMAYYSYYYIIVDNQSGIDFVYLETSKSHNSTSSQKQVLFVQFKTKYDRFYKADCFDAILSENPDMRKIIKKE